MLFRLIFSISLVFLLSCSVFKKKDISINERFERAEGYFLNNKFQKAKNDFQFILQEEQGSELALKSTLYLAETLFELEEYEEASYHFNYYSMFSKDIDKVQFSQFMKCKCLFKLTKPYKNDQSDSFLCISTIQEFLDNFSSSIYTEDAYDMVIKLRNRIAKKYHETARLYLKMKKFESAFYYLDIILSDYYDTKYHDEAIISYIFSYILIDNYEKSVEYFNANKEQFKNENKLKEAEKILSEYKNGIGFSGYYRLYK